ncbi:hypothetical protein FCE95_10195 [Luteimonas gilva]|uniref:Transmembrane protein n=1 Tax=Luteimonas gilva TaxID=2572684 RepID=A0A4U5JPB4_9GAMM|nr:hypothetical protein FCE95_10195 [Luteimonas gilva]
MIAKPSPRSVPVVDPRLDAALRQIALIGLIAVLTIPAARGSSVWLGWMPLWLLAMPLTAWWALHRFRLPRAAAAGQRRTRPRAHTQARRRTRRAPPSRLPQVA